MSALTPDRWQEISPYLDHALSLAEAERSTWFATFRAERPDLADLLGKLLQEHRALAEEHFLEQEPLRPGGDRSITGEAFGAYRLMSRIGEGGMGNVWLAERMDGRFERQVAVKFLNFAVASQGAAERFKREGRILGQLAHPHIAELIDAGVTTEGEPYLVLEYVKGRRIDEYCDESTLDVEARIRLFLDVLEAVAHAHTHLIVHRDIKPPNVLVTNDGGVKLLDFGIAKLLAEDANSAAATLLTMEGGGAMTPLFAAPEQVKGGPITTATDVYALGMLLYLSLSGQHPVGAGPHSPAQLVKAITETEPPLLSDAVDARDETAAMKRGVSPEKLRRSLRGDLDLIVKKALKKDPRERYVSVAAFGDDLRCFLRHETIAARPDSVRYRVGRYVRRHRAGVAVAIAMALLLIGFTVAQAVELRRITRERDRADHVTSFMIDMFRAADSGQTHGTTVTARDVLDQAAKQVDLTLVNDPGLKAEMMAVIGAAYSRMDIYATARPLLERAIEVGRRANGPENRSVLSSEVLLGTLLIQQGEFGKADSLLAGALSTARRSLGERDSVTLDSMSDLAYVRMLEGRKTEALDLSRRAFEIRRSVEGDATDGTLWSMNNLAVILGQTGHLSESEAMYRAELEIKLREHGRDSGDSLNVMGNLAGTLILEGRLSEAGEMFEQLLPIERRVLGDRDPETGRTLYNLACVAARQGRRDEAFSFLQQAVPIVYVRTLLGMGNDSDLASLHDDPRWSAVVKAAEERIAQARKPH